MIEPAADAIAAPATPSKNSFLGCCAGTLKAKPSTAALPGQVDEMVELFGKACAASPRACYLYLNLARALGLLGDLAKPQTALAEALRLNPKPRT